MTKISFLNGFWLKMIMVVLMLLDHLYYDLFPAQLGWAHAAARVVAPVFVFLMTEGLFHTRNRSAYLSRMYLAGGLMLLGNTILAYICKEPITNSILLALAASATLIVCIDNVMAKRGPALLWILGALAMLLLSPHLEGLVLIPFSALIFYYLRSRPAAMYITYILVLGGTCLLFFQGWNVQCLMVLAVVPIALYNGKRGPGGAFSKYFFYVFYPVHLWIIYLVTFYLGKF